MTARQCPHCNAWLERAHNDLWRCMECEGEFTTLELREAAGEVIVHREPLTTEQLADIARQKLEAWNAKVAAWNKRST